MLCYVKIPNKIVLENVQEQLRRPCLRNPNLIDPHLRGLATANKAGPRLQSFAVIENPRQASNGDAFRDS